MQRAPRLHAVFEAHLLAVAAEHLDLAVLADLALEAFLRVAVLLGEVLGGRARAFPDGIFIVDGLQQAHQLRGARRGAGHAIAIDGAHQRDAALAALGRCLDGAAKLLQLGQGEVLGFRARRVSGVAAVAGRHQANQGHGPEDAEGNGQQRRRPCKS